MLEMYPIQAAMGALLALAILSGCASDDMGECPAGNVVIVGHRGTGVNTATNPFPENTIESFVQGIAEGAAMIELDVTLTADNVLVVMHDATVNRTTDGDGCVSDMSLADLKLLDAGADTPMAGMGLRVPTFTEVLEAIDTDINIEIKVHDEDACAASDLALLAQHVVAGMGEDTKNRRFVVSSFDADALTAVQQSDPDVYLALLSLLTTDAELAASRGFQALNIFSGILRRGDIEGIQSQGLEATVWTENEPVLIEQHLSEGVNMIITDEPDVVETVRSQWCSSMGYP
jgi:glycerophosphoryl diester phosphodiesterase